MEVFALRVGKQGRMNTEYTEKIREGAEKSRPRIRLIRVEFHMEIR